jgi:hypothetical protein
MKTKKNREEIEEELCISESIYNSYKLQELEEEEYIIEKKSFKGKFFIIII